MFSGGGSEQFAAAGIPAEILALSMGTAGVQVYPDNWQAVKVFRDMATQWRAGPGGPIGLDYGALPSVFRIRGIAVRDRSEIFDGIQIMEAEALKTMREAND